MIPGSKVINDDALAHEWLYDLMTRPNMRIKVGCIPHDIRILGRIVGVRSTEQSVWHLLTLTSYDVRIVGVRSTERSEGIMGANVYDPNIIEENEDMALEP